MDCIFVYVTMPSQEVAQSIARTVVGEKLAACANVLGVVWSCFHWEGDLCESAEALCILKTTRMNFPALEKRIVALHPYEVPCIVAMPLEMGHAPFLDWVQRETNTFSA